MNKISLGIAMGLLVAISSAKSYAVGSQLGPAEWLLPGNRLVASGCYYNLQMQNDGNLVLYAGRGGRAVWSTHTGGQLGEATLMQGDGNLLVGFFSGGVSTVPQIFTAGVDWHSQTGGHPGSTLYVQDDGNLTIRNSPGGTVFWASNTGGQSLGQSPCFLTSTTTKFEYNFDRPGGDFSVSSTNSLYTCATSCSMNSSCRAFTWVKSTQQCWLKSSQPGPVSNTNTISGVIRVQ